MGYQMYTGVGGPGGGGGGGGSCGRVVKSENE